MITLAASMFDVNNLAQGSAQIGETLFLAIGAVVAALALYGVLRHRRPN